MAPLFLPIADLPVPGDLIWCKFPKRHLVDERRVARPVLVRASEVRQHHDGYVFGVVTVTYGTDTQGHGERRFDLFLDWPEWERLGLHKATVFILDAAHTKTMLWRDDLFIAPEYLKDRSLFIGYLSDASMQQLIFKAAQPRR